jgi:hypothetical protein
MSSKVVISRKWNNPEILGTVTHEEINLTMSLAAFLDSVKAEMIASDSATLLSRFTTKKTRDEAFKQRFDSAVFAVVLEIKQASAAVV